jgi:hypothetical protein
MLNQIPTNFGIPAESQFQGFGITLALAASRSMNEEIKLLKLSSSI